MTTNKPFKAPTEIKTKRLHEEIQVGADYLLASGVGGIALWIRRDEVEPRVAVRCRGTDLTPEDSVAMLAALHVGLMNITAELAKKHQLDPAKFEAAVVEIAARLRATLKPDVRTRTGDECHP